MFELKIFFFFFFAFASRKVLNNVRIFNFRALKLTDPTAVTNVTLWDLAKLLNYPERWNGSSLLSVEHWSVRLDARYLETGFLKKIKLRRKFEVKKRIIFLDKRCFIDRCQNYSVLKNTKNEVSSTMFPWSILVEGGPFVVRGWNRGQWSAVVPSLRSLGVKSSRVVAYVIYANVSSLMRLATREKVRKKRT